MGKDRSQMSRAELEMAAAGLEYTNLNLQKKLQAYKDAEAQTKRIFDSIKPDLALASKTKKKKKVSIHRL